MDSSSKILQRDSNCSKEESDMIKTVLMLIVFVLPPAGIAIGVMLTLANSSRRNGIVENSAERHISKLRNKGYHKKLIRLSDDELKSHCVGLFQVEDATEIDEGLVRGKRIIAEKELNKRAIDPESLYFEALF